MAEKRVSVRLVAEGGRQVRAELEGIGEAGSRCFCRLSPKWNSQMPASAALPGRPGEAAEAVTAAAAAAGVAMV
jgi:hypothetical protein